MVFLAAERNSDWRVEMQRGLNLSFVCADVRDTLPGWTPPSSV